MPSAVVSSYLLCNSNLCFHVTHEAAPYYMSVFLANSAAETETHTLIPLLFSSSDSIFV